jgi:uncharacterized PurR-regulated membrane protein YhhQ (DUF165 family)
VSIVNRVVAGIIAVAAMAAAAGVVVVAAAFAIYTLLRDHFGPAGAAAMIAAGFAVALALGALIMFQKAKPPKLSPRSRANEPPSALADKVIAMLTERPIVAARSHGIDLKPEGRSPRR